MNRQDWICHICSEPGSIVNSQGIWCRTHWDEAEAAKHAEEKRLTVEAGGPWPQTCPRRYTDFPPRLSSQEDPDTWDIREQFSNGLRARHCSFCGSLHPDDFMRLLTEGWLIGATDKNYKVYLHAPSTGSQETKFYFQHLSLDQKQAFVELYNQQQLQFSGGYGFYSFPYFMKPVSDAESK